MYCFYRYKKITSDETGCSKAGANIINDVSALDFDSNS